MLNTVAKHLETTAYSPRKGTRVYMHDYSAHVSQMEVARALARKGYEVEFAFCDGFPTPHAELKDEERLRVSPISIGHRIVKKNYLVRQWHDVKYGLALVRHIRDRECDIVLSCNTPLWPETALLWHAEQRSLPIVHWWSDVYSHGIYDGLSRKSKLAATVIGYACKVLERRLLRRSDAVVPICDAMAGVAEQWGVSTPTQVIPLAAPVDNLIPVDKSNTWSVKHGLESTLNIVYAGTLGVKHNPSILSNLAADLSCDPSIRLIVISTGSGAEFLQGEKSARGLGNLLLFPFQPFDQYINVLASADIQLVILDESASKYSVPSKFASQLCSGRPQVAIVTQDNDAARLILEARAGLVSQPNDYPAFLNNVKQLVISESQRKAFGLNGRRYVMDSLHIDGLLPLYEQVIHEVLDRATEKP